MGASKLYQSYGDFIGEIMISKEAIVHAFCKVIKCERCNPLTDINLLRDKQENIPQPGYIGKNYEKNKLLLIGQNPGICPPSMKARDTVYMKALSDLGFNPTILHYEELYKTLQSFVPEWPVHRNYFPLEGCGLGLEDIAYCNIVRCRTSNNRRPSKSLTQNCINEHLIKTIDLIDPKVIVFIGKWSYVQLNLLLKNRSIKLACMNRDRSLSAYKRDTNRMEVIETVLAVIRNDH
jgi:hypothetical protein